MTRVYAKHEPYTNGHLAQVTEEMRIQGAPTIRVVKFKGELYATQGSHRLAAAAYLGLIPRVWIEETESDVLPAAHWEKVSLSLPAYDFPHVLALEPSAFEKAAQEAWEAGL